MNTYLVKIFQALHLQHEKALIISRDLKGEEDLSQRNLRILNVKLSLETKRI